MNPATVAERYFVEMRARDLEGLATLFAADAVFVLPNGTELSGLGAIRAMYEKLLATSPPTPTPLVSVVGVKSVATEIETQLPDGNKRRTANFFHLDDAGRIKRLSVYMRSA